MLGRLFLFPILIALLGGNAVIDQRNSSLSLEGDGSTGQSAVQSAKAKSAARTIPRPDLKIHIDAFSSPGLPVNCLGSPTKVGYLTVKNVGNRACNHPKVSTAFGYTEVSGGLGVVFQVTSVGVMPDTLAAGAEVHMIVQGVGTQFQMCNAQKAIYQGYVEVNEPVCKGEINNGNNKATKVGGTIYNPN